jgi:uncharacterized protein
MKNLTFISTEPYSGKTGLAINSVIELRERGRKPGFFKPVGNLPVSVDSITADQDALFAKEVLGLPDPPGQLCPLVLTSKQSKTRLQDDGNGAASRIKDAFDQVLSGKELLVLEGSGHINDGRLYGASALELAGLLDLTAVLVVKPRNPFEAVDDILVAADRFGDRLAGVIFNWVKPNQRQVIEEFIVPFLDKRGVDAFGLIPQDESLSAVSVDSLARELGGRLLCAEEKAGAMVETFMVGAMGQEQALRFFRRKANKAVITGGDRADVQLAALETPTACLILTGNYMPSATVLSVAESKGVPLVLVDMDTLTAVERTEKLIGQMRVHDTDRLNRFRRRMTEHLDLDRLFEAVL